MYMYIFLKARVYKTAFDGILFYEDFTLYGNSVPVLKKGKFLCEKCTKLFEYFAEQSDKKLRRL